MRFLIVNNLAAGFQEGSIYDFVRSVSKDGDEVVIRNTDGTTDLRAFVKNAASFDMVIAAGGDGTVSTVSYLLANTGIPILVFPAGTDNLIAQNLLSPNEPHALAKIAREGKTMDFDIGEISIDGNRYGFGGMVGIGYGAIITKEAKPTKKMLGPLAYVGAALSNAPKVSEFTIIADGVKKTITGVGILVLNFTKIGLDLRVTHKNMPRDGKLDIVVLKGKNALDYLPALTAAALDNAINFPDRSDALECFQANSVEISGDPQLEVQIDGETSSHLKTPVSMRIIKHGAKTVVSDDCIDAYK